MHISTAGIHLRTRLTWVREWIELISSMRFAISLLVIIAIASVIGTVLKQNEPFANYVNQFGPFWFEAFRILGLYSIYNAFWFLIILGFLVLSTTLCLVRNAPKMLRDMRSWRTRVREASLRAMGHHAELTSSLTQSELVAGTLALLQQRGFRTKTLVQKDATLIAAKAGTWNRLGYIFAHSAIVVICLGGLLDSELLLKAQVILLGKTPVRGDLLIRDVPPTSRLSFHNPSFRANALVPEGTSTQTAIVSYGDGAFVQELPFTLKLKKFIVEYYSTGMPKLFASDVEVTDPNSGKQFSARIKVNQPLIYQGIAIYQSSFEDGGSALRFKAWPLRGTSMQSMALNGQVGGNVPVPNTLQAATIEFSGFRAINVENLTDPSASSASAANHALTAQLAAALASGSQVTNQRNLRNVGPSVQYKIRDRAGQAREYDHYMLPLELDGQRMFVTGMRTQPNEAFRYLRIPADANDELTEFMRLRAALQNPQLREQAAQNFALSAMPDNALLRGQLSISAQRSLDLFAGSAESQTGGYVALADFMQRSIAPNEQARALEVMMKVLGGSFWELWQASRVQAGLKPAQANEQNSRFVQQAMNALSDLFVYDAPVLLQLEHFDQVQASVFQLTRSPGKIWVYWGCGLLVCGIFAMFYIRERRIWVWIKPQDGAQHVLWAISATRSTLALEQEFASLQTEFNNLA